MRRRGIHGMFQRQDNVNVAPQAGGANEQGRDPDIIDDIMNIGNQNNQNDN